MAPVFTFFCQLAPLFSFLFDMAPPLSCLLTNTFFKWNLTYICIWFMTIRTPLHRLYPKVYYFALVLCYLIIFCIRTASVDTNRYVSCQMAPFTLVLCQMAPFALVLCQVAPLVLVLCQQRCCHLPEVVPAPLRLGPPTFRYFLMSWSILPLSKEDDTIPLPGYSLSMCFRDSFRKFWKKKLIVNCDILHTNCVWYTRMHWNRILCLGYLVHN